MFCRRISRMNASLGRVSAMYVKLCSGPTPMYAPPGEASLARGSATWRYEVSLEMVLSEKKGPSGSESAVTFSPKAEGEGAAAGATAEVSGGAEARSGAGTDPRGECEGRAPGATATEAAGSIG